MRAQIAAALLALAAPLHAIKITSPAKNDVVDPAAGITVKWTTVSTDPTTAHLFLVNMASGHTPYSKDLGEIDLTKGSFTVTESDVPDDEAYQFNFQSVQSQNTGILAQSEQFEVKAGESDDDKTTTKTTQTTESVTVKTSTLKATSTITKSDTTVTSTATTLATVSETVSRTGSESASATGSATSSSSTGAAAPTGAAVKAGSLVALVAGVAAVLA